MDAKWLVACHALLGRLSCVGVRKESWFSSGRQGKDRFCLKVNQFGHSLLDPLLAAIKV